MMLAEWLGVAERKGGRKHEVKDKLQAIFNHFICLTQLIQEQVREADDAERNWLCVSARSETAILREAKKPEGVNEPETGKDIRNVGKPSGRMNPLK